MTEFRDQFFEIPGRLAGANEYTLANRTHYHAGATLKKKETARCAEASIRLKKIDYPVKVVITWIEPNKRRDVDNISFGAKFVLDGLIESGKLANDGRKQVRGISHEFPEPCPKNPRVHVWIQDCQKNQ